MKIKLSIFGIIAAIFGFIASSAVWIYFKDTFPLIGTISVEIKLAPVKIFILIMYENLARSRPLFISGSVLMIFLLNIFEFRNTRSGKIIQLILFLAGITGLILNLLGLINFFTTIIDQSNSMFQPTANASILPGLGIISAFLSLILGGFAIFVFIRQRGKLSKSLITLNISR